MKKLLFIGVMSALMFTACSKSESIPAPTPDVPTRIPINISMGVWSRVTDTAYESGDKVGIYVVNYIGSAAGTLQNSGNHVDNMRFSYTGVWTPDQEIYWKDQTTKADFYCYYPYAAPSSVAAHSFDVKADQSTAANYKASELLWGKATGVSPTADAVPITTTHAMSSMIINVTPGEGFTEESLAAATVSVKVCNVKTAATINLATGTVTATGSAAEVTPLKESASYRALIVPQTVADGTNLISVTVDDVTYTLAKGFTFRSGTQHKFTVSVNKATNGVNIGVGKWDVDETDNGGAAE